MRNFTLSDFDFDLPPELVAQHPAIERTSSRLLDGTAAKAGTAGTAGTAVDRIFKDLPSLLRAGDLLVFNDTRVVKARLFGEKPTGGKLELLVERVLTGNEVVAHMKVSKKPQVGTTLQMVGGFRATLLGRWPDDQGALFRFAFDSDAGEDPYAIMSRCGHVPLPPYITHTDSADDESRYQTVFARVPGAVAAPTAALHFDETLLAELAARGIERASVTLHVGAGTFLPMRGEAVASHTLHAERGEISAQAAAAIAVARGVGGRLVAVGTTSLRLLESAAAPDGTIAPFAGETALFIRPGHAFRSADLLLTNFHLPRSTLFMLACAFAGTERMRAAYAHAVAAGYRFYSYGDASLLERA